MAFHCLFEQSGTFKNEFKKLGFAAYDYDILNDFNETDFQIDLFNEIEKGYQGGDSIFDGFTQEDTILAFFPCTRFEVQIIMGFRGELSQMRKWNDTQKLEYDLKLHEELHQLYNLVTKLSLVALRKNLKLIIENPFNEQHYLTRYWAIKPKVIHKNRKEWGDYYEKPTQYWFINIEPKSNFIFEPQVYYSHKSIENTHNKVERSLISHEYANRFIREYLI